MRYKPVEVLPTFEKLLGRLGWYDLSCELANKVLPVGGKLGDMVPAFYAGRRKHVWQMTASPWNNKRLLLTICCLEYKYCPPEVSFGFQSYGFTQILVYVKVLFLRYVVNNTYWVFRLGSWDSYLQTPAPDRAYDFRVRLATQNNPHVGGILLHRAPQGRLSALCHKICSVYYHYYSWKTRIRIWHVQE